MKDFVREYGRIAAIFAVAAFILSLIVGLFSGNPFGIVLLRALMLAVVFALLGAGVAFVVTRYLPELAGKGAVDSSVEAGAAKHTIDIVLPEENPANLSADVEEAESVEEAVSDESGVQEAESVEEVEELSPSAGSAEEFTSDIDAAGDAAGSQSSLGDETEPLFQPQGQGEAAGRRRGDEGIDTLDSLPDIGDLEVIPGAKGAAAAESGPAPRASESSRIRRPEDVPGGFIGDEDPETLAKAIRTVLKRDEKG